MLDERNTSTTLPGEEPASLDDDKLTYTLAEAASCGRSRVRSAAC